MFDELRRALRRLEGPHQISVEIETDDDGYFDRQCPSAACMFEFKVQLEDWHEKIGQIVVCPFCGHSAESEDWNTQEQSEHYQEVALSHINRRIDRAMRSDALRWNRKQPHDSFLTITMRVEGRLTPVALPPSVADPMRLKVECLQCGCRYAFIGAAFFCPGCGRNDAEGLFKRTILSIRASLDVLGAVRSAIGDKDTAENTVRAMIENGLQNAITAFQGYAEALFLQVTDASKPRRNAFQNIAKGSKLWFSATGNYYSEYLSDAEYADLKCAFQQRHLLAHTQGIVDQDYIDNSGDTSHQLGQRLVISEAKVGCYLNVIQKLAIGLLEARNSCCGQPFN